MTKRPPDPRLGHRTSRAPRPGKTRARQKRGARRWLLIGLVGATVVGLGLSLSANTPEQASPGGSDFAARTLPATAPAPTTDTRGIDPQALPAIFTNRPVPIHRLARGVWEDGNGEVFGLGDRCARYVSTHADALGPWSCH